MRTESEIQADIDSLTGEVNNLQSIAPPLSGVNLALQQKTNALLAAYQELVLVDSPEPVLAGLSDPVPGDAPKTWKKKK